MYFEYLIWRYNGRRVNGESLKKLPSHNFPNIITSCPPPTYAEVIRSRSFFFPLFQQICFALLCERCDPSTLLDTAKTLRHLYKSDVLRVKLSARSHRVCARCAVAFYFLSVVTCLNVLNF